MLSGWRGLAVFAVSVLIIVPLKSGTAVGSHPRTDSLSSVGLLLSVNTAYLAFIVLVLLFVIFVSVNPEIVVASSPSLWFPPDRGLPALPLSLRDALRPLAAGLRWTRGSRLFSQTG